MDSWEAWLTLAVAGTLLISLALRVAATDLLAISCLGILVLAQNLTGSGLLPTPEQAVAGFGNQGLITIALLFAVVAGLEFTGGTELATGWFLNRAKNLTEAQVRLLLPVAAFSGFMNNTPVVVALMPVVSDLAKRISASTSRLLLPLSYAAVLGGMCTLIGTSTNLIIADLNREAIARGSTAEPLSFFSPAAVGIPATLLGLVYMIITSRWLIPERRAAVSVADDPRQYTVEMQVDPADPWSGGRSRKPGCDIYPGCTSPRFSAPMV